MLECPAILATVQGSQPCSPSRVRNVWRREYKEVASHIHPKQESSRTRDLEDFIGRVALHGKTFAAELKTLLEYKDNLNSDIYYNTLEASFLRTILTDVRARITDLEAETPAQSKS